MDGTYQIPSKQLQLYSTQMIARIGQLSGQGLIDLTEQTLNYDYEFENQNLSFLSEIINKPIQGGAALQGNISGSFLRFRGLVYLSFYYRTIVTVKM